MRATLVLVLGAVVWVALPSAAFGATAHVGPDESDIERLFYSASPGEANQVEVSHVDAGTTIHDSGATITAGSGCMSVTPNEVFCSGPFHAGARIRLGDGDDEATVLNQTSSEERFAFIYGGAGNDALGACEDCPVWSLGGLGNDSLSGGRGSGSGLFGEEGSDTLTGDAGLSGGDGNDFLTGNPGFGVVGPMRGGPGDDMITGGGGDNDIKAGPGDDTIAAGGGNDSIDPHRGDDTVDGGPGKDQVSFRSLEVPVFVNLRTGRATGAGDTDTLVSIWGVTGGRFSDRLIGDAQDNFLDGGRTGHDELQGGGGDDFLHSSEWPSTRPSPNNDDRLFGGVGNDRIQGGRGADLLVGGPGLDRLWGHGGDDRFDAKDEARDIVNGGRHLDRARVDARDDVKNVEVFF